MKLVSVGGGGGKAAFTYTYTLYVYVQKAIRMPGPQLWAKRWLLFIPE